MSHVMRRTWGFLAYLVLFAAEVVLSSLAVTRYVLFRRRDDMRPGLLSLSLRGLSRWEILVLSHSITLTPGTTSVRVSQDRSQLLVHALDASDPGAVRASIEERLKKPMLRFTR